MKKLIFILPFFWLSFVSANQLIGANMSKTANKDSIHVLVPNVFTPNGDGINDTWSIILTGYGVNVFDMQTTVYDRWGKQVFQTTNIREVWAGHNSIGEFCSSGTYFYVITYTNGSSGKNEAFKGFVELMK